MIIIGNTIHSFQTTALYDSFGADVQLTDTRVSADAGTREPSSQCLDDRLYDLRFATYPIGTQPSIAIVPQSYRNGVVYNELPVTRTNFIQNNTMVGATGSVRPNLWDLGSLPSGFTVSYSASGQTTAADGTLVDYIDVTVSGTALASGFLNLRQTTSPSPVSGNLLFASGMTYTASVYLALLSGSLTGVATNAMALQEIANTTFVANTTFAPVTGITSALTRFTGTRTMDATGGADRTSVRWGHSIVSGTSYDYTVRIASPQLEKGSVATPIIRTVSGFVTVQDMVQGAQDVNLARHSEDFAASGFWTLTDATISGNTTTAPDGTMTADTLTATSNLGQVQGVIIGVSGTTYTGSIYIKRRTGTGIVYLRSVENVNTPITITNDWTRVDLTATATTTVVRIGIRLGTSGDEVDIWGAQVEVGSTATPYIPTTTSARARAAYDGAPPDFTFTRATTATRVNASGLIESVASGLLRLDYPIGGGCPAALIEPSASNGILNSTDTTTNWTCWSGFTSGVIDVLGVSGVNLQVNTSGSNIGAGTGNGNIARTNNNVALASGSTYTLSFFIKKTGAHTIGGYYASITGAASGDLGGGFNVSGSFSSGSIYNTAGTTNRIRRVEQWGTDVYRCSETFTMTASGTLTTFRLAPVSGVTLASLSAVGTELGFAAPQIELSSVPTTFIPTTTGSATRNADVCTVSGVSGYIGQTEGTIYWEGAINSIDRIFFSLTSGTSNSQVVRLQTSGAGKMQLIVVSGTIQANIATTEAITVGQFYKVAVAYKQDDFVFYLNGAQVGTDTSGSLPTGLSQIQFSNAGATDLTAQRCRAAAIYTTRLSNEQLESLTRLT